MTKIGIVVTVFNKERFIGKCLKSILHQTLNEIEVIVVDDGSTDASGKICDMIAARDSRMTVIHQSNQGISKARLNGVKRISSDYVTFVDGDDWIDERAYERIVNLDLFGQVDLIACGIIRYYADCEMNNEINIFDGGIYESQDFENKIIPNLFWDTEKNVYGLDPSLCTKVFQKKRLEKSLENLQKLNIHYGEDIAVLYPLVLESKSIAVLDACYYYHRMRKNNMVAPYIVDNMYYAKLYKLYEYLLEIFKVSRYSNQLIRQLDYFYMYSIRLKKLFYKDLAFEELYMFPFDKIIKGSKIVLYGAGQVGQTFYKQLQKLDYCKVIGWVDMDYSIYDNELIKGIDCIKNMRFDYILIAISASDVCMKVQDSLVRMGVGISKIIRYK